MKVKTGVLLMVLIITLIVAGEISVSGTAASSTYKGIDSGTYTSIDSGTYNTTGNNGGIFVTLGDSITARDKQLYGGVKEPYKGYQQFIKETNGFASYINLGISGSTIARGTEYLRGLTKLVNDYTFDGVEFISVFAGTNDFALGVALGDKTELEKDKPDRFNFYGGYAGLVQDLKRNNPEVSIYLYTPTKRDCSKFEGVCVNKNGYYLDQYVQAVKDVAEYYNVTLVDVYNLPQITQENIRSYTVDGLHLNDKGYELVANKFNQIYMKQKLEWLR